MAKFELTEEQEKNLKTFLGRVNLQGNEAIALVSILQALNNPIVANDAKTDAKTDTKKK